MLYQITYMSDAVGEVTDDVLENILEASRRNNTKEEVTGLLLHQDGHYIQVIEGELEAVVTCFERICQDPRHQNLRTLLRSDIRERLFKNWAMGTLSKDSSFADLQTQLEPILKELTQETSSLAFKRTLVFKVLRLFRSVDST
jgi:hypothetical protein